MTDRERTEEEIEAERQRNRAADPDVTAFVDQMRERFNAKVKDFRILQERDDWDSATSPVTEVRGE